MSDPSDPSRFEPPPAPAPPAEPTGTPRQASVGWVPGSPDNPYQQGERYTFDASPFRPTGQVPSDTGRSGRGGGRRLATMGLGATALAAVVLGGGYLAYDRVLGGGGAQPESAIPANALAFAKVDLDPSGGQKVDALRFIRKFPTAPADTKKDDADLRKVVFDQLQESGQFTGLDYAKDVQPWLGSRFAVAALPGTGEGGTATVLALAVTDVDKARAGLAKLSADRSNTHCAVGEDFALCGEDADVVAAALKGGKQAPLADAKGFSADFGSIGEDGIAAFWVDMSRAQDLAKKARAGGVGALTEQYKGHFFGALRFDGPTLELVGKGTGLADSGISGTSNGVPALPADTLAAFGLSGGKDYATKLWANLEKAGLTSDLQSMTDETGLSLPRDLQTLLGTSFAVAFGGMDEGADGMPKLALVTDSAEADVRTLADKVEQLAGTPLSVKAAKGRTVVGLEQGYADTVAAGKGLGDDAAFKAAVPDADSASVVLYANIGRIVQAFGSDMSAEDRKMADVFKSVGVSAGAKGSEADFRMRLTTN
jgi:hypothetical protein